ncbi:MAG: ribonucleotide reductase N-terminal alpha domain-containing protein, partial [Blautia coccoides]
MIIIKRNGQTEPYDIQKIKNAVLLAFKSVGQVYKEEEIEKVAELAEYKIKKDCPQESCQLQVEQIQDIVERSLTELNHYEVLKSFILYRNERSRRREARRKIMEYFREAEELDTVLKEIQREYTDHVYHLEHLHAKFLTFYRDGIQVEERLDLLKKAAVELTTQEAPLWEFAAGRILHLQFTRRLEQELKKFQIHDFYEKIHCLTEMGLYGGYILENYSKEEILRYETYMQEDRNHLFNYSGLELLLNRYVIKSRQNVPLESVQEMFLGIAMHLAMPEKKDRDMWVQRFYDILSTLKVTMATPTLSNARKPYHQLSSCFIDTVPDSLDGIYRSIDNFAKVSKFGGGMGLYFGKVRAAGSDIRGFEGAAGGVI